MKKILLIDDDHEIIELTKERLEANGYKVETACDGEQGLHMALTHAPDLIVADIKMPKLDGYSFVKIMKREKAAKRIPIIVLTAFVNMKDLFSIEGVDGYMAKPFKAEELLSKIKECLNRVQDGDKDGNKNENLIGG